MTANKDPRNTAWLKSQASHAGDECLTWPFGKCNGYGILQYQGKITYAHRVMCRLVHGEPPSPAHHASHSCGKGHLACVNPKHLSWKTQSDNQRDRARHGTKSNGGVGKINDAIARRIRELRGTKTQGEIGRMFGISRAAVSLVQNNNRWRADKKRKYVARAANG